MADDNEIEDENTERTETFEDGAQPARTVRVNYPPNSKKSQERSKGQERKPVLGETPSPSEKNVKKVIQGEAIQRKKGLGRKIRETFVGDDMHSVGDFIIFDVAIPAVKNLLADAATQGFEKLLFGDSRGSRRIPSGGGGGSRAYVNYNRIHPAGRAGESERAGGRDLSYRARAGHDFREVILESRGEADYVLDQLVNIIQEYGVVTVSDLYELVGITGSFTDQKWGWDDLRSARVESIREGYLLNLPRTKAID